MPLESKGKRALGDNALAGHKGARDLGAWPPVLTLEAAWPPTPEASSKGGLILETGQKSRKD